MSEHMDLVFAADRRTMAPGKDEPDTRHYCPSHPQAGAMGVHGSGQFLMCGQRLGGPLGEGRYCDFRLSVASTMTE